MQVMKFGGGCLRDARWFLKVADILRSVNEPIALVVSAVYGVTNQLADSIRLARESDNNISSIIEEIREKHQRIISEGISNEEIKQQTLMRIDEKIQRLERLLYGVAYIEEIVEPIRILILSYGERLATITLAGVLNDQGIESKVMESNDIGLLTDYSFDNATALLSRVKKNFQETLLPFLRKGCIPVITGFFGCTENGKISSFGRNGSDYSAAVVAYGLGADSLIIWKDVDGFMSADPKLVPKARKINRLSFYEAAELSYFGAKILHPRTLEPLMDSKIKVNIRNIDAPMNEGTIILSKGYKKSDVVKSVTYNKEISVLKIQGPGVGYKPGIIGHIGNKLSENGINIYSVITSQTCINLLIHPKDATRSFKAIQHLIGEVVEKIIIEGDIALIAVVGEGVLSTKGVAAKVFSAVAEKDINVEMISAGASTVAYYFIINEKDTEKAIEAIHNRFFD